MKKIILRIILKHIAQHEKMIDKLHEKSWEAFFGEEPHEYIKRLDKEFIYIHKRTKTITLCKEIGLISAQECTEMIFNSHGAENALFKLDSYTV